MGFIKICIKEVVYGIVPVALVPKKILGLWVPVNCLPEIEFAALI
jgi:hypothetical protein